MFNEKKCVVRSPTATVIVASRTRTRPALIDLVISLEHFIGDVKITLPGARVGEDTFELYLRYRYMKGCIF